MTHRSSTFPVVAFAVCLLAMVLAPDSPLLAQEPVPVEIKTNMGTIQLELNPAKAPKTVENFLNYARKDFYDQTIFHRVIDGFMIQGGGFAKTDNGIVEKETGPGIQNEAKNGLKNSRGSIAMARTSDPHSATSQFFINVRDNSNLDYPSFDGWGYAVFGRVTDGMDVVDKIRQVPTTTRTLKSRVGDRVANTPMQNVPRQDVVIQEIRVLDNADGS